MQIEIREIHGRDEWEGFMNVAKPPTFLHSWAWGDFNQKMGSKVWRLGIFGNANEFNGNKRQLIACALILKIEARRGTFLFCPHGPIFAGIKEAVHNALHNAQNAAFKAEILKVLTNTLRDLAKKERCDFVRICPLLLNAPENQKIFYDPGFREAPIHMHPELAWILKLDNQLDELLMGMRKTTRYCIKRAQKDEVETSFSSDPNDAEFFWKVYQQTVDRQNFTPFSKAYLRKEFETFGDQAQWFFAKHEGEILAAAMIIFYGDSAFYHHGASTHSKIPAPYLLQWAIIEEAKKRGCDFYNFWGISPEDKPRHPWAGLSLFKKGFGGFAQEYVHAQDMAITPKYWLNWILETIRRIKRGL